MKQDYELCGSVKIWFYRTHTKKLKLAAVIGTSLIILALIILLLFDEDNINSNFLFSVCISLGAGLIAAFITGKIIVGPQAPFFELKTASGGMAIFVLILGFYHYMSLRDSGHHVEKYFELANVFRLNFDVYLINKNGKQNIPSINMKYNLIKRIALMGDFNRNIAIEFDEKLIPNDIDTVRVYFDKGIFGKMLVFSPDNGWDVMSTSQYIILSKDVHDLPLLYKAKLNL